MGIQDWEADHVTLVLEERRRVHQEVQLLGSTSRRHRRTTARARSTGLGFNHVCFRVTDLDAMLAHLAAHGITPRNEVLDFHDRTPRLPRRAGRRRGAGRMGRRMTAGSAVPTGTLP